MDQRLKLHRVLRDTLGSSNVYFQPPANITMQYPCIIYERNYLNAQQANNHIYTKRRRYQVTVIDPNPDSDILNSLEELPLCTFSRHYKVDNLNHDVYDIYF